MHPPADPWGSPIEPTVPVPPYPPPARPGPAGPREPDEPAPPEYGRASVPVPPPRWPATGELPSVEPGQRRGAARRAETREFRRRLLSGRADREPVGAPRVAMPDVSWRRASPASRRTVFDGWGFTAAGLLVAFCGWGVWAAAGGGGPLPALVGFILAVAVGGIVFAVLRLASRVLFEQMLHRRRPHARWAHFLTGTYLTIVGISYIAHTSWLTEGLAWFQDQWQRL